jgi:X-Pro dipeptidyl-peptidase
VHRRGKLAAVFVATLCAAVLVAPRAPAAAGAGGYDTKEKSYVVPTRHGKIYVEVVRPVRNDGSTVKGPAIFTYSPYSVLGRNGDAARWVPDGYVRVWADVVGTGNSGGCYDYGGVRERETGYDLVEWIADQSWSNGKVAMTGGSYNGTTAVAAAVERPPHLTTIVPEAAISRWYEYAFSGGIRYFWTNEPLGHQGAGSAADEGFDTPLAFDFGFAIPPPVDATGEDWAQRVGSTITPCEEVEHTLHGYDFDTPNYGRFWEQRDYVRRAGNVTIPVLIAHNWGDWNVKQEEAVNLFRALDRSRKRVLYMGTRWDGHGRPGGDYQETVEKWFAHYLMGRDNGVQNMPSVVSQTSDYGGPGNWHKGRPDVDPVTLIAQEVPPTRIGQYRWKLLPHQANTTGFRPTKARFPSVGINTESHAAHHARNNHDWFYFETPTLGRNVRIFGEIKVRIYSTVQRKWITYTPSILDFAPSAHIEVGNQHATTDPHALVAVTRGWLDSRYRNSLAKPQSIAAGKPFGMTVVTKPQDYVFKQGHRIGLNIQTEINEWSVPKIYPGCDGADTRIETCPLVRINWEQSKTRLVLPVVNAPDNPHRLFTSGDHHHH